MFGASRKYALALLDYLDQQRVTRRVGDARVLR
jgi:selenocysteine-specific elongation factor